MVFFNYILKIYAFLEYSDSFLKEFEVLTYSLNECEFYYFPNVLYVSSDEISMNNMQSSEMSSEQYTQPNNFLKVSN
jgi:hypothetical protein